MQFKVPQFIEIEDKLVGPLTLKQFLFFAAGGAALFIAWFFLTLGAFIILAIPIIILAALFAFYRPNGRPFVFFLKSLFQYLSKPKLYLWRKKQ